MQNIFSFITSNISSRLAGFPQAMMRVDNFILNARAAMKSLLTWMETICQKLKTGS